MVKPGTNYRTKPRPEPGRTPEHEHDHVLIIKLNYEQNSITCIAIGSKSTNWIRSFQEISNDVTPLNSKFIVRSSVETLPCCKILVYC